MATKAQQAIVSVSTAEAAADTISGATAASPVVVTATAHGISNGAIARITGVGGMTQLNDRAFVIDSVATNTANLKGVDGSAYSAYTSGGSLIAQTMTPIGYVKSIGPGFNGQSPEIDTTHLRSTGKEYELGLADFGEMPFSLIDVTDAGQTRLRALHESAAKVAFSITLPDGRVAAFMAMVKELGFDTLSSDTIVMTNGVLRVSGYPARFA